MDIDDKPYVFVITDVKYKDKTLKMTVSGKQLRIKNSNVSKCLPECETTGVVIRVDHYLQPGGGGPPPCVVNGTPCDDN